MKAKSPNSDKIAQPDKPKPTNSPKEGQEKGPAPPVFAREKYNPDELFTYKPHISNTSQRLIEKNGEDFMSRQNRHLAKQKRYHDDAVPLKVDHLGNRTKATGSEKIDYPAPPPPPPVKDPSKKDKKPNKPVTAVSMDVSTSAPTQNRVSRSMTKSVDNTNGGTRYNARDATGTILRQKMFADDTDIGTRTTGSPKTKRRSVSLSNKDTEKIKNAKNVAEKAIRNRKIFTIIGPYGRIRNVLREKGWVEKFYKLHCDDNSLAPQKKSAPKSPKAAKDEGGGGGGGDDDVDDDDGADDADDQEEVSKVAPWDEDDGIYGIMSRCVRNVPPTFIWSLRKDQINFRYLNKDQVVNHHAKACNFTTKVGLCKNLRQLPWFENQDPDDFFPRCYVISEDEERDAFVEDFRLNACMAFIKVVVETPVEEEAIAEEPVESVDQVVANGEPAGAETAKDAAVAEPADVVTPAPVAETPRTKKDKKDKRILPKIKYTMRKKNTTVPQKALDMAIKVCERWLQCRHQEDIDTSDEKHEISAKTWDKFISWYYQVVGGARIEGADDRRSKCEHLNHILSIEHPQYLLDGIKNVWIIKPGAKSRGRGIFCADKLEEVVKLVKSSVPAQACRYVAQKYIERPLLIYNTKFDIRQWFLVTDWNPLTIWWYKECYFRFCSQEFTLVDFNESVHLSNNSIQYKYENGVSRSNNIPEHNMWDCSEFKSWVRQRGDGDVYEEVVLPGMKEAVINSLLCTQDLIEYRKNCFELYGADFMITEDYQPWLIEINSSPCMAPSTPVTARLTEEVLVDTVKVVLDRRPTSISTEIGKYELIYQQKAIAAPPYVGIDLTVAGNAVRRPWNNASRVDPPVVTREKPVAPAAPAASTQERVEKPKPTAAPAKPPPERQPAKLKMTTDQKPPNVNPVKSKQVSSTSVNRVQHAPPSLKPATRVEIVDLQNGGAAKRGVQVVGTVRTSMPANPSYTRSKSEYFALPLPVPTPPRLEPALQSSSAVYTTNRSLTSLFPFSEKFVTSSTDRLLLPAQNSMSNQRGRNSSSAAASSEWWKLPSNACRVRPCPTEFSPYAKRPVQFPEPRVSGYKPKNDLSSLLNRV